MAVETMLHTYLGKSAGYFTLVGVLIIAYIIIKAASSIWTYFLSSLLGFSFNFKNVGSWAVVTGCTDGIGKAYTENLAKRGLNVVLISRSKAKLQELSNDLESRFKVQTKAIVADFTKTDIYDNIHRQLSGLDIGTLVNNVGMSYEYPEFFHLLKNREKFMMDIINCNTVAVSMNQQYPLSEQTTGSVLFVYVEQKGRSKLASQGLPVGKICVVTGSAFWLNFHLFVRTWDFIMTSIVLPDMVAKKKGVIINIASSAGKHPIPMLTLYSATKAFVIFFSRCLQAEYQSSGIIVQTVAQNFVTTKMSKLNTTSFFVPTPEVFVCNALATVGLQSYTHGYWRHAIQETIARWFPDFIFWKILLQLRAEGQKMESNSRKKE